MLPSSHRRRKTGPELNDNMTLGDIERYYKKTNAPVTAAATAAAAIDGRYDRDATGARDKSKIRKKISKQNGDKNYKEDSDDVGDDGDNDGDLNELEPSYIESYISDTVSLSHIAEEEEYESKYDNGLSIKTHKMTNIKYPFADKPSEHLTHDLDNIYENLGEDTGLGSGEILVEYLVYYINKKAYKPFLEFMLYKSDDDDTFYFPNFSQDISSYDILENADLLLDNLLGADLCTFKGRLIETDYMNDIKSAYINQRVILLYELKEKNDTVPRMKKNDTLWWATVSELINYRKILFYNISDTVTDIFLAYTQAIKLYHNESLIETPMVVFNGSDSNSAKYNAVFSIKKSDNESRYGPFYYFTDLYNAMRYSCYDNETHEKNKKGGLVRFIIYPGKMKMFLEKNKPDRSEMAKYICSKHPIEKNTIQFRDNDCKWTEQYNSVYNGIYKIPIKKSDGMTEDEAADVAADVAVDGFIYGLDDSGIDIDIASDILDGGNKAKNIYFLAMRICINEYIFQTPLSYYYIDTKDIPNKYEYDFKNYKII
jgi:hypothetical protein